MNNFQDNSQLEFQETDVRDEVVKTGVRGGARSGDIVGGTIVRKVEDGGALDLWRTVFQKTTEGFAKGC